MVDSLFHNERHVSSLLQTFTAIVLANKIMNAGNSRFINLLGDNVSLILSPTDETS